MDYNTKRSTDSAVEATEELLEHLELASEEKENMPGPGVCAGERHGPGPGPGAGGEPNCDIACDLAAATSGPASTAQCTKMTETEVADRRNLAEIKI